MPILRLLRPQQWIKNVFLFAGPVFGKKLGDAAAIEASLLGFLCLCLVSSLVYVINDIHDREEDRLHPTKCKRPIPSGQISVAGAIGVAVALGVVGLGGSWLLDRGFAVVALAYLALQLLYTFSFKHAVILDVIAIGMGFVLRAIAGAVLVHVAISPWLVLCTFTLCLFMGFGKRRCELRAMVQQPVDAHQHRRTLAVYTIDLLNHMTTLTAGVAITSFMLYTIDQRTVAQFGAVGSTGLLLTLPIVVYAIFRFTVLVEHGEVDGPTDVALRDRPFQFAIGLWILAAVSIVYGGESMHAALRDLFSAVR